MLKRDSPADGCKATREGLKADGYGETAHCPICKEDYEILCRVVSHPVRQSTGNFLVFLSLTLSDDIKLFPINVIGATGAGASAGNY